MRPIQIDGTVLAQLEDSIVLLAHESQALFAEKYGGFDWRVDLADTPLFWFEREPRAFFRPQFIGSVAGASATWLWGWENINGFPDAAIETAQAVRAFGEQTGTEVFTTAELDLSRQGDALVHSLVRAAMAISGTATYYRAPTGPDSFAWFLVDNPDEFSLPEPHPALTASLVAQVLGAGLITDPKRALSDYAERRGGMTYTESEDGAQATITMAAGSLLVQFDELGRIRELSAAG